MEEAARVLADALHADEPGTPYDLAEAVLNSAGVRREAGRVVAVPALVGLAETAALLGVSRQRAAQLRESDPRFPVAVAELRCGPVFAAQQVVRYVVERRARLAALAPVRDDENGAVT